MKTYLECIPCFLTQALEMVKLVSRDKIEQKVLIDEIAKLIPDFALDCTPPEMARLIHKTMEEKIGEKDFYEKIKKQSNEKALKLYPRLKEKVKNSKDRLLTAVEIAIAGNVIDYASKNSLHIENEIERLFISEFSQTEKTLFDYEDFKKDLNKVKTILYIGDNAGEIVFDRVLIEEIPEDKKIIFAVRNKPVINDATLVDARFCGIDKIAEVISSGVDAPGAILKYCSPEFNNLFNQADMVISKGQGNYEALNEEARRVYFLFRAKCPVVASHAGLEVGHVVLMRSN